MFNVALTDRESKEDDIATKLLDVLRNTVTHPEMPEPGDYVGTMSIRKSKGLTSRVVIVAGCIEGLISTGRNW